jgi:hypothetical protein
MERANRAIPFRRKVVLAFMAGQAMEGEAPMFDMLNPALREAKKRAKEEYQQRMLQGKMDEAMRRAHEKANRNLAQREKIHQDWLKAKPILLVAAAVLILFAIIN